jgi:hypothetical protein
LLLDVIDVLNQGGVRYMIVGAMAAAYHGVVRASRDADAAVSLPAAGVPALVDRLRAAGLAARSSRGAPHDPSASVIGLSDAHGNSVDLLWGVRGMEKGAFERRRTTSLLESSVDVIGAEDFIAMKISAGSPKDLGDVEGVLAVSGHSLDVPLLRKVTRLYGASEARMLSGLLKKHLGQS